MNIIQTVRLTISRRRLLTKRGCGGKAPAASSGSSMAAGYRFDRLWLALLALGSVIAHSQHSAARRS